MTEVLAGGASNYGKVLRVGETVRRPLRPHSPAVHRLLRHLEDVGFVGAPRFLGVVDGHEVLTFVDGEVLLPPLPSWAFDSSLLASVARLVRAFHDACASFPVLADDGWDQRTPARWSGSVLCHGDLVRSNVVLRDRRPVALIDFDLVAPASRVWEIACALRHWVPLRGEGPEGAAAAPFVTGERLRAFCDVYGLPAAERPDVLDAVLDAEDLQLRLLRQWVAAGHEEYRRIWEAGAPDRIAARVHWVTEHRALLLAAMT